MSTVLDRSGTGGSPYSRSGPSRSGRITRQELRDGDVVIVGEPDCLSLQVKLG